MDNEIVTLRANVFGKVQGVGFRAATVQQARLCQVVGWVRNAADGSVEVLAQGSTDAVDNLLSWLYKGPAAARVEQVEIIDGYVADKHFKHFEWR